MSDKEQLAGEWFGFEHGDHEGPFCRAEMGAAFRAGFTSGRFDAMTTCERHGEIGCAWCIPGPLNDGYAMTHRGIRLRISISAGRILDVDSDMLHNMSVLDAGQDWHEIIRTVDGLVIESRAVMLPDEYPDD